MSDLWANVELVDDRLSTILDSLKQDENKKIVKKDYPHLIDVLDNYLDQSVETTPEDFIRGLLQMFRDSSDDTYQNVFATLAPTEQDVIEKFVKGQDEAASNVLDNKIMKPSPGFRAEMHSMAQHMEVSIDKLKDMVDDMFHDHNSPFKVRGNVPFHNWGGTVNYTPSLTCVPHTVAEIQQIVQLAEKAKLGVRVSGYRHSWAPVFGRKGDILISLLDLDRATKLPNTEAVPCLTDATRPPTELEKIEVYKDLPSGKKLVRIGVAATNERLRRWCINNKTVTLPLNIIMVEITIGGSNGPICHGAGRRNRTLSDLVRRIEYIDAHGQPRIIEESDKEFLSAAGGCFGLLGVITHLTIEFDPMSYAVLRPAKVDTLLTIPPPREHWKDLNKFVPGALFKKYATMPQAQLEQKLEAAQKDFELRAANDYYAEWFWFPYSDQCWINTWNNTTDASGVVDWPGPWKILIQFAQTFLANVAQKSTLLSELEKLTGLDQAATTFQSRFAMMALPETKPNEKPIKAYLIDALHFFRCIQNVPVRDCEVEMPLIPSAKDKTKPDFSLVQRGWWDAILQAYKYAKTSPQRMPLEMRIMGGSDVVMAPQRGNTLGTCSIEVLTLESMKDIWTPYAQEICDKWLSYVDPSTGKKLKTRPHWAKEWYNIKLDNGKTTWLTKLRDEDYKAEIAEFKQIMTKIGQRDGWTLADLKHRFSNDMFDELIFFDVNVESKGQAKAMQASVISKSGHVASASPVAATGA